MQHTDIQLVERYLQGDEEAFGQLVDYYLKPLYNFVLQLVGDSDAAQDIVQESFVKVWKKIRTFDKAQQFKTWIYTITKNTAYDWMKKKRALPFATFEKKDGSSLLEFIEDENSPHSHALMMKIDNTHSAKELLDSLSPQLRTVFLLHHKHGFALAEIAHIMGHSPNTLKSKYRRAIANLRKTPLEQRIASKKSL